MEIELILPDPEATDRAGAALGSCISPGLLITLSGELGAGKTALVRAMLRALHIPGRIKSPTFSRVELYEVSKLSLYHFDFYRVEDPAELDAAGFREYFRPDAVCLVEWPERAGEFLRKADVAITLDFLESGRTLRARAFTPQGEPCLTALAALRNHCGSISSGDASAG